MKYRNLLFIFCLFSFKMVDAATRKAVGNIPQLKTKAGPRDKDEWVKRLKEEYASLISYVKTNKESDTDWFRLESNKEGTRWFGKCWHIQVVIEAALIFKQCISV